MAVVQELSPHSYTYTIVRPEHGLLLYEHCKEDDYYVFKPIRRISLEIDVVNVSSDGKRVQLGISSRSVRPFDFSHEAEKSVETVKTVSSTLTLRELLDQCITFTRQHFTESEVTRSKEEWKLLTHRLCEHKNNTVGSYV